VRIEHRNLPESIDSAVTMSSDLIFDETDAASDIEVLSESDNDDVLDETDSPAHKHHRHHHGKQGRPVSSADDEDGDEDGDGDAATLDDATYHSDEGDYEEDKSGAAESGLHDNKERRHKKTKSEDNKKTTTKEKDENRGRGGHEPEKLRFDDDIPSDMDEDDRGWLHGSAAPSSSDEDVERGIH
jgi:hypothetical protein